MRCLLRSGSVIAGVAVTATTGLLTLIPAGNALGSLQYPFEHPFPASFLRPAEYFAQAHSKSMTSDFRIARDDSSPVPIATDIEEPYFSPDGLRGLASVAPPEPARWLPQRGGVRTNRILLWGGLSAAGMLQAYRQSQASWGSSNGTFHVKSDFKGDGLAMTDEASHLLIAFRLSRLIESGYRWSGAAAGRARLWGAAEAWLLTFLVEYPIDAYNPQQGFGVSDLIFNTAGVMAAYAHSASIQPRWDIKVSAKRQFFNGTGRIVAYDTKQYDDFVYWVTYRPIRARYAPLLFGAGYSTRHSTPHAPIKEFHLGVGTSLEEIGAMIGPRTERFLRPLNFCFFNLAAKISWR